MLISSRGRYALLVMIDLAGHRGGLVPGRQIAERLELSQKYLERILRTLAEAGLIEGLARQGRRLPSPAQPRGLYRGRDPARGGGYARLPRRGRAADPGGDRLRRFRGLSPP